MFVVRPGTVKVTSVGASWAEPLDSQLIRTPNPELTDPKVPRLFEI
jgi:hypothetical protein